jgi:hypothetical protein
MSIPTNPLSNSFPATNPMTQFSPASWTGWTKQPEENPQIHLSSAGGKLTPGWGWPWEGAGTEAGLVQGNGQQTFTDFLWALFHQPPQIKAVGILRQYTFDLPVHHRPCRGGTWPCLSSGPQAIIVRACVLSERKKDNFLSSSGKK